MDGLSLMMEDKEVACLVEEELNRQRNCIELIASENYPSSSVLSAAGSILTCKYAEGYPGHRYYGGCEYIDGIERLAIDRAKQLFGAEHANVQPHCGTSANLAVYQALLEPGDKILAMGLDAGGHLSHGTNLSQSGQIYDVRHYGVDKETGLLDYDAIERQAKEFKPKLIVAGASAYPRKIDFARFREIADKCGALLMVDMAHIAGLVAAGLHMSPVPYADVVTTTTHKTLRGPRGGMILCKDKYAKSIDKAVFPSIQGGPLEHIIAAKAVCFGEALKPEFRKYQEKVLLNIKAMEYMFAPTNVHMVTGGSDNHLLLLDLRSTGVTGKQAEERLGECGITVNKNSIPGDPQKPTVTSGIRIGTAAITSRGFSETECRWIAALIVSVIEGDESVIASAKEQVRKMTVMHPLYPEWCEEW